MRARNGQDKRKTYKTQGEAMMKQLLVHETTFARIETALKPYADRISPIVMDDEGDLKHPWGESEAGQIKGGKSEAVTSIAYGTQDAYFSPAVQTFFQTMFALPNLEFFQSSAAGIEHPMLQAIGQKASSYASSHAQSEAIAEWVLWAGLEHFQNGAARRAAQAAQDWKRMDFREISDTHWLIIGFGGIGRETGKRLKALGAQVTGVRRSGGSDDDAHTIITPDGLAAALPTADAVLLSVPHTPETDNMARGEFFAAMKPDSLFVNVGRGALVDEDALLAALDSGQVAHAALDVVRQEPLPMGNAIWTHPKITLTPHIAALTEQAKIRTDRLFLKNLGKFFAGEPLHNAVPKTSFGG
jgi:phosphoglycerate dehydrogenase-like enzyme